MQPPDWIFVLFPEWLQLLPELFILFPEKFLLWHDALDFFFDNEGIFAECEVEDVVQSILEVFSFNSINLLWVKYTNRVVNKYKLFLTHLDLERLLEFLLHLLNKGFFICCLTPFSELNRLSIECKFCEANEQVFKEFNRENLGVELY